MAQKAFKADGTWVVELDDHEWYEGVGEHTAFIDGVKERGKLEGCTAIAIFAVPDALFPLYGHTTKKRVHSEQLASGGAPQFAIFTSYRAEIPLDVWTSTPDSLRGPLVRRVRDELNERGIEHAGRYEIVTVADRQTIEILERGRV